MLMSGRNEPFINIKKASLTALNFNSLNISDCQLLFSIPVGLT